MRAAGFGSAEAFVGFVASGYDQVRTASGGRLTLVRYIERVDRVRAALIVELRPSAKGDGREAVTGGVFRRESVEGGTVLWTR